jgi:hypothetical protein
MGKDKKGKAIEVWYCLVIIEGKEGTIKAWV